MASTSPFMIRGTQVRAWPKYVDRSDGGGPQKRLGHASSAAALRYIHAAEGRDLEIAKALSGLALDKARRLRKLLTDLETRSPHAFHDAGAEP